MVVRHEEVGVGEVEMQLQRGTAGQGRERRAVLRRHAGAEGHAADVEVGEDLGAHVLAELQRGLHRQAAGLDDLVVVDARIDPGPMFKRIRPRARGMAFGIKRRMSHIKVALDTRVVE